MDMVTLPRKMIKYHFLRGENQSLFCKNKSVRFQKNKNTNNNLIVDMVTLPRKMIKYHFSRGENLSLFCKNKSV